MDQRDQEKALKMPAGGKSVEDVLNACPELEAEDKQQAMRYAGSISPATHGLWRIPFKVSSVGRALHFQSRY